MQQRKDGWHHIPPFGYERYYDGRIQERSITRPNAEIVGENLYHDDDEAIALSENQQKEWELHESYRLQCVVPNTSQIPKSDTMRTFDTGATRSSDAGKLQYTQYFDPGVLRRVAEYLREHNVQADGQLRAGDNWKKGIPVDSYMGSLYRHVMEVWELHDKRRNRNTADSNVNVIAEAAAMEDTLCAVIFNAMGMLYERLRENALHSRNPKQ